jgi:hypothetical protein
MPARISTGTTRIIFIGGIVSTGTTALKNALMRCDFATTTGRYREGQHDPDCPPVWPEECRDHAAPATEAFQRWIESYCRGPWLIEKTPGRYIAFLAIQKRLGSELACFLMTQRDPYQMIASNQRRWSQVYGLRPDDPPGRIAADHPKIMNRLRHAIEFHRELRPQLEHFEYVRYEELCARPRESLAAILAVLGVEVAPPVLERAAATITREIRRYAITPEAPRTRALANELCRLWGYPEM